VSKSFNVLWQNGGPISGWILFAFRCSVLNQFQLEEIRVHELDLTLFKKMAIDSMSTINANTAPSLILDSELRKVSANANIETLMAHIDYCGWTTRGWTLQEGSLPKVLVFAFVRI
jgi:hypothetical protein